MFPLLIALLSAAGFLVAYHTYGRWLGGRIFALSARAVCPSRELSDGVDYVPTGRAVVFGHHFTSIAGTGPIVGPAIAIMWGWLPALLWVVLGSIFIGAVHDLGALVVSLRNRGQTVGDIAGKVISPRARWLFLSILVLSLTIVLAIFGLVIASVFRMFPAAIFPCLVQIPLAIAIGLWMHRRGRSILGPSMLALGLMYLSVLYGNVGILGDFNQALSQWSTWTWVMVLLLYSYAASVLPVWTLLQPRDYINALQLVTALGLVVLGLVVAALVGGSPLDDGSRPALEMAAPMIDPSPEGAPFLFPFLFITIACGAISGFHCLVSSGTSSKQIANETDARFVGYGSMLTEGFLAVLVILACGAGLGLGHAGGEGVLLTGQEAWNGLYGSWATAAKLGAKVDAFVSGAANLLQALGLPGAAATALMGVFVASFAGTTLDTACRLQRYVIQELASIAPRERPSLAGSVLTPFRNRHGATLLAVLLAGVLAAVPRSGASWSWADAGSGGMLLWPLFGATNQLLAGLAFLVIAFWLRRNRRPALFLLLPLALMVVLPMWAMVMQVFVGTGERPSWIAEGNRLLAGIGIATILLEVWMVLEAIRIYPRIGVASSPLPAEGMVRT